MAFSQSVKTFSQKTVTLAAENVTTGFIDKHWRDGRDLTYISYSVPTGDAAPTAATMIASGAEMFADHPTQEGISSTQPIDVYVYASREGGDTTVKGKLVVSI